MISKLAALSMLKDTLMKGKDKVDNEYEKEKSNYSNLFKKIIKYPFKTYCYFYFFSININ